MSDLINELSDKIQKLENYALDDKLTINFYGDYELDYKDLCKLRSLVDDAKCGMDSVERIYYNLLKHREREAVVTVSNDINNLRKALCECVVFDKNDMHEVKDSPARFNKISIDYLKGYIRALVENIAILQTSITKEIK